MNSFMLITENCWWNFNLPEFATVINCSNKIYFFLYGGIFETIVKCYLTLKKIRKGICRSVRNVFKTILFSKFYSIGVIKLTHFSMLINISKIIFKQLLNKSNVFYFCKTFYNSLTQLLNQ